MHLPKGVFRNIMSYLHREFDWERKQVMDELEDKCKLLGSQKDDFLDLVPALMLPTRCMFNNCVEWYILGD